MCAKAEPITGEILEPVASFHDLPALPCECVECGRDVLGEAVRATSAGLICAACDGEIDF